MVSDSPALFDFPAASSLVRKSVVAKFDGGDITSDAGLLLLSQADAKLKLTQSLAEAIVDRRQASKVDHRMETLLRERIYAIASGYPDANDLDTLRHDPALKTVCGLRPQSGKALASQPSISRLENALSARDLVRMGVALAKQVIAQLPKDSKRVILDVDPSDDPCHGQQEFEFFNRHYDCHCYLPLYLFVTDETGCQRLLSVLLRPGTAAARLGLGGLLRIAVKLLRQRFPTLAILLRADAGFGVDQVLRLCDRLQIEFVLGLSRNSRLQTLSTSCQIRAAIRHKFEGEGCREFDTFLYKAHPWNHKRQVIIKAEITREDLNPRFIVVSDNALAFAKEFEATKASMRASAKPSESITDPIQEIYRFYCSRGDIENRIKEMKLDIDSGRTSCHRFLANQARLLLSVAAGTLLAHIQQAAAGTRWAKATMGTLRARLLKVGARVVETCRNVWFHLPTSHPEQEVWKTICQRLC